MAGGRGGGSLLIVAKNYTHTGTITANGADGTKNAGGGGGGGVCIATTNIKADTGSYSVKGGACTRDGHEKPTGGSGEDGVKYLFDLGGAL